MNQLQYVHMDDQKHINLGGLWSTHILIFVTTLSLAHGFVTLSARFIDNNDNPTHATTKQDST